ncbi:MAG: winged helix-turn-helix transcriptional regulator [Pseudomonadota bacterium]|nr:winged helix-turn-helix transcriptional regulator [Pseudomonadota bacterium]MEC8877026.1 winged helix-turn-helix transcriptional regulator [Pseudomonadota bacterium]MED5339513.1 winged helix-turn-helix transcriptional regulator [Pseudomonadota bacterium]MEE3260262.1 winged helix-turn-helix transcriptional regulator [Pseudomonadota bacterium]
MTIHEDNKLAKQEESSDLTLGVLEAIDSKKSITQRSISKDLDMALGLVNSYLKRCVKKGFIKIQQAPKNRYLYYLTPRGFSEKTKLTAEFLTSSFTFFRKSRDQIEEILDNCNKKNWKRILLFGNSELAEITSLYSKNHEVQIIQVYNTSNLRDSKQDNFPPASDLDAIILTDLTSPQKSYEQLVTVYKSKPILVPKLLKVKGAKSGR